VLAISQMGTLAWEDNCWWAEIVIFPRRKKIGKHPSVAQLISAIGSGTDSRFTPGHWGSPVMGTRVGELSVLPLP